MTHRTPVSADQGVSTRRPMRFRRDVVVVTFLAILLALACIAGVAKYLIFATKASAGPSHPQPIRYLGVYEPDTPGSYADTSLFAHAVGRWPNLVGYYSGWQETFQKAFAEEAASHGAMVLVQMDPAHISLAKVSSGFYDSYLTKFAEDVAAFGRPVVISFGREMNGSWYSWGYHHTHANVFVAAWRHVVDVFRRHHANNVNWLWQVNSDSAQTGPVREWWPGARYVTWVGISGYYFIPDENAGYIFQPVAAQVKEFTQDPVLIAETGVNKFAGQSGSIHNLFAAIRTQHYIGLVWFDLHTPGPLYQGGNWRLEGNYPALRTFRQALRG